MRKFFSAILSFWLSCGALAADYYIDYTGGDDSNAGTSTGAAWQYCPGMTAFTGSYSHSAGDRFIFKGGETWPMSPSSNFTISYSGTSGNIDTYTSDESWYTGGSWSRPTLDGQEGFTGAEPMIYASSKSYFTIEKIRFIDTGLGDLTTFEGGRPVDFRDCSDWLIDNCYFDVHGYHSIVASVVAGNRGAWAITNSTFTNSSNSIEASVTNPYSVASFTLTGNTFFDPHDSLYNSDHGDGIHLFGSGEFTEVEIGNNKWYGDFSGSDANTTNQAMIYLENSVVASADIHHNDMSFSNTSHPRTGNYLFQGFMVLSGADLTVRSNTMNAQAISTSTETARCAIRLSGTTDVADIRDNIMVGCRFGIEITVTNSTTSQTVAGNTTSNRNLFYDNTNDVAVWTTYYTVSGWNAAYGEDGDSVEDDPDFVDPPDDHSLLVTSPAIGAGTGGIDIGAYQYDSGGGSSGSITATTVNAGSVIVN